MHVLDIIARAEQRIAAIADDSISPGSTAMASRKAASLPARIATRTTNFNGLVGMDMGCGNSIDAMFLQRAGARVVYRYDPVHVPLGVEIVPGIEPVDFVLLAYVLNVLPPEERKIVAECAMNVIKPGGFVIVGVREDKESVQPSWIRKHDGYVTTTGTFQSFFDPRDNARIQSLFPGATIQRLGKSTWKVIVP